LSTELRPQDGSSGDPAFRVEQHGIDFIPTSERWATPRNIGAMWAGSSINVEYFIYGALLMGFGFSFWASVSIIVLGNLSFLLLGVASLQGPTAGTTTFTISRSAFGTRGARIVAFFNWITMLGFETEGLILIVGAFIVLSQYGGITVSTPLKVIFVFVATAIQAVLPYLGHATMVRVLRALIVPFVAIFIVLAFFMGAHAHPSLLHGNPGWPAYTAALAFTIALSGLGWTECGNDYTRYLPADVRASSVVGWIFVATALPEIILMILGALATSFLSTTATWSSANPFFAMYHQSSLPTWFVILFLLFSIVQLFGINSLDLYSSGVSIQAMGFKLRRYQAVLVDSVIAGALTMWAVFGSTFSVFMKDFVGVIIVWIAPWFGIFIVDWLLRHRSYAPQDLQEQRANNQYWGTGGFRLSALVSFVVGLVIATMGFSKAPPPVNFPLHWMTPISNHFGAFYCSGTPAANCGPAGWFGGADFSIYLGVVTAGVLYALIEVVGRARTR
jgi:nucleobase:cation symporter-1, NCS1 family